MAASALPAPEVLRQLLDYCPITGALSWKVRGVEWFRSDARWAAEHVCARWNTRYAGRAAFTAVSSGYRVGRLFRRNYLAHRVIWVHFHGQEPEGEVDHRDNDRQNNRIWNLRDATHQQNGMNRSAPKHNTSGFKGVSWNKRAQKWAAEISAHKTKHYLGLFETAEAAASAYDQASAWLHGDYAKLNDRLRAEQPPPVYN